MTEAADATEELGDEQRCSSSMFHAGVCTSARPTARATAAPIACQGWGRAQSSVCRARHPVRRRVLLGYVHESFPQHPPALRDGHRSRPPNGKQGELPEVKVIGWPRQGVSPVEWWGFGAGVLADEGVAVR